MQHTSLVSISLKFFSGVCHMGLHCGSMKQCEPYLREEATLQDALALICPLLHLEVLVLHSHPVTEKVLG